MSLLVKPVSQYWGYYWIKWWILVRNNNLLQQMPHGDVMVDDISSVLWCSSRLHVSTLVAKFSHKLGDSNSRKFDSKQSPGYQIIQEQLSARLVTGHEPQPAPLPCSLPMSKLCSRPNQPPAALDVTLCWVVKPYLSYLGITWAALSHTSHWIISLHDRSSASQVSTH